MATDDDDSSRHRSGSVKSPVFRAFTLPYSRVADDEVVLSNLATIDYFVRASPQDDVLHS